MSTLTQKHPDFGITRVTYDESGLIDELEVRPFDGEILQNPQLWIRVQLAGDMKKGLAFATLEHVEGLTTGGGTRCSWWTWRGRST